MKGNPDGITQTNKNISLVSFGYLNFDNLLRSCVNKVWDPGTRERENNQERIEMSCQGQGPN